MTETEGSVRVRAGEWISRLERLHESRAAERRVGVSAVARTSELVAAAEVATAEGVVLSLPAISLEHGAADGLSALRCNHLGQPLQIHVEASARDAVATAMGVALAGLRASCIVEGDVVAELLGAIGEAKRRMTPLVIHWLANGGVGAAPGQVVPWGCPTFVAASAQEAVDLCLAARLLAEQLLTPVVVMTDAGLGYEALQQAKWLSLVASQELLGRSGDWIDVASPVQRFIFGARRRRVPRLQDVDQPLMSGAEFGPEAAGVADAGSWLLGGEAADPGVIVSILERISVATGRGLGLFGDYHVAGAERVIVVRGAAAEVAERAARALSRETGRRVGVLSARVAEPSLAMEMAAKLSRCEAIFVLEPLRAAGARDPLWTREIQAGLARALSESTRGSFLSGLGGTRRAPRVLTGLYSGALRAGDIRHWCEGYTRQSSAVALLSARFVPAGERYPKQRQYADELEVSLGSTNAAALRVPAEQGLVPQEGEWGGAIYRSMGESAWLAESLGSVIHRATSRRVRGSLSCIVEPSADYCCDRVIACAPSGPRTTVDSPVAGDAGAACRVALAIVDAGKLARVELTHEVAGLGSEGVLLLEAPAGGREAPQLPSAWASRCRERGWRVVWWAPPSAGDPAERDAQRLGAALGAALLAQPGLVESRHASAAFKGLAERRFGANAAEALAAFEAGMSALQPLELPEAAADGPRTGQAVEIPAVVRCISDAGAPPVASLPSFFSQTAVLYRDGATEELASEPRLASRLLPPASAALTPLRPGALPRLVAERCTGCGACYSVCPDGAWRPLVAAPVDWLRAAQEHAIEEGADVSALAPFVDKLGRRMGKAGSSSQPEAPLFGSYLSRAFDDLLERAKLPPERVSKVRQAFERSRAWLETWPALRTEHHFDRPERDEPGTGRLFSLILDPEACKGCGLCLQKCDAEALVWAEDLDEHRQAQLGLRRVWEQLPDTRGPLVAESRDRLGELEGLLLSRHCLLALGTGDTADAGSMAKLLLRHWLAAVEHQGQLSRKRALLKVEELRELLAAHIRESLSAALPAADLDALARGIEAVAAPTGTLAQLTHEVERVVEQRRVDLPALDAWVTAGRDLADAAFQWARGSHGLGRARGSFVIERRPPLEGLARFPSNVFSAPVVAVQHELVPLAKGLLQGLGEQSLGAFRSVRHARAMLANSQTAMLERTTLDSLRIADLTPEELEECPPLCLVVSDAALRRDDVLMLLGNRYPVKILLLADGGVADGGWQPLDLLALGLAGVFVAQVSLSRPDQEATVMGRALRHPGPAVIRCFAPSPRLEGVAADRGPELTEGALVSRAFPVFVFDPLAPGVLGGGIELGGNPQVDCDWCRDDSGRLVTMVDWLCAQPRYRGELQPLPDAAQAVPVTEWLARPVSERAGTAVVVEGLAGERLSVSPRVLAWGERRFRQWRALQEIAGHRPFVERIEADVRAALQKKHDEAMAALCAEHELELERSHLRTSEAILVRVRERLLKLSGYAKRDDGGPT